MMDYHAFPYLVRGGLQGDYAYHNVGRFGVGGVEF